jgi:hypothetical protein
VHEGEPWRSDFFSYCGPHALHPWTDQSPEEVNRFSCDPYPAYRFTGDATTQNNYWCVDTKTGPNLNVTRYDTMGWAMLTTFDIMNLENWQEKMQIGQYTVDASMFIYFFSTVFFLNVLVVNLFPAAMSFSLRKLIHEGEADKEHAAMMQQRSYLTGAPNEMSQFEEHMVKLRDAEEADVQLVTAFIKPGGHTSTFDKVRPASFFLPSLVLSIELSSVLLQLFLSFSRWLSLARSLSVLLLY